MKRLKAIDLFCGAGGLTEGLKLAGFNVIGAVESDSLACETYLLNQKPNILWQLDIRDLSCSEILKSLKLKKGELDLLAGCPPCQGFSRMRSKNGRIRVRDSRNDLIFEVLRLAKGIRPKTLMIENVPGLVEDRRYSIFCDGLSRLGYFLTWQVLDTADYSVPQHRRRLVLLASRYSMPEFGAPARRIKTVRDAIGRLVSPKLSKDPLHNYSSIRSERIENLIRMIPRNGGSRKDLDLKYQLQCHRRCRGFADVYGRMAWDKPAPTITGGCVNPSKGRFIHPKENRAITLREAALLQTFPKRYKFIPESSRDSIALLIGNALPPEFIRRHALRLKTSLNESIR